VFDLWKQIMIGLFKKMDFLISLRHASYRMCIEEYFRAFVASLRAFVAGAFVAGLIFFSLCGLSLCGWFFPLVWAFYYPDHLCLM
jgi:hypothetical protein